MKTGTIVLLVFGAVAAGLGSVYALFRVGAPAAALSLALGVACLLLVNKVRTDPYVGWGYLRAFGVVAALASGVWTLIAFVGASPLLAVPLAMIFVGSIAWIQLCTRRIRGARTDAPGLAPRQTLAPAAQNLEAANDLTGQVIANARRLQARGRSLNLQGENLDLTRRNRELEDELAALRRQAADGAAASQDPFYDPIPKA
jgi:hypothetical protein